MANSSGRANGNERKPDQKPHNILMGLFKRYSPKPNADSVPAGISRRATIGGKQSRFKLFGK